MRSPNELFESYVEHSYRYYQLDEPVIPDSHFDLMCVDLLKVFGEVTHPDKRLTSEDALQAGTGFQMMFKWPQWVKDRVAE
ncbi:hypothetical protein [Stenotrophomonas sp. SAU14A_NAIMI4_8]|uniref:DNA ligase LigA-related protein n=1 Tax=Stenotrophomonas sp. SAU14A_NAIMI4_8 TaxID=2072409 RepID=UPI000D5422AC|nr:hypothetical protein [Stenotrophomonas sp. SAU14A_NAIMI4_8]AWH32219.1 hypothetical protein C1930_04695 [Stenotrophomonas sp. SAU14A_NAIMI4_8]